MTPNTYHEEIPDQDVVDQLERMERRTMAITPDKLRELAHPGRPHPQGFHQVIAEYQNALRAAADEIERLKATSDRHLTEMTQLKLAAMGWTKSSP